MAGDIWLFPSLRFSPSLIWTATGLFSMSKFWVEGSYYCHKDWCNYNEYCCGVDLCCDYLKGYWYIWLISGLLLFSLILICCWLRYHRFHSSESVEARNSKLGYIPMPGTVVAHGDKYLFYQQPQQVPFAREPLQYSDERELELKQQRDSRYYPPPYDYIERKTPSAPPEGH